MPVPEPSLHHIGYVVASIAEDIDRWKLALSAISVTETYEDEIQQARVAFLDLPPAGLTKVELVEPLGQQSRVASFLEKGGGLHHLCFEVDDLDKFAREAATKGYPLSDGPHESSGGSKIAFIDAPEGYEIELIQRAKS